MPIVFVHGVSNRLEDKDYKRGVELRTEFLKSILAPKIGIDAQLVSISFPYWGGEGVKFRWDQASVPTGSDSVEALTMETPNESADRPEVWEEEARFQYGEQGVNLGLLSRAKGFATAVDLVLDMASTLMKPNEDYISFLMKYNAYIDYVKSSPAPHWAMQSPPLSNEEFLDQLVKAVEEPPSAEKPSESLSIKSWYQELKEALSRLSGKPSDVLTSLAVGLARKSSHAKASRFLGDVFVYLDKRGTLEHPGKILEEVLTQLRAAQKAKKAGDDKLIVIGHSLGGVILYDVLTYFATDIKIDTLVTVGSQVALFEEMALYRASSKSPINPKSDRLQRPANVGKWLNIYDTNDIFSFLASAVFNGVDDYRFDTGYGLLDAHGGYFSRPSFYKRLAIRLNKVKVTE